MAVRTIGSRPRPQSSTGDNRVTNIQLRRLTRFTYGDPLAVETRLSGDVPVMSSGGITGTHEASNTLAPVIVIGRKGSFGSVHWNAEPAFVIDTAYFVDSSVTSCHLRWLYYVLLSADFSRLSRDVGVPGLSREAAYEALVPAPPALDQQRRVADFLDVQVARIDTAVELHERQLRLADEQAAAVAFEEVTAVSAHPRSASSLSWAPSLPQTWRVARLSTIAEMGSGHTPSRSEPDYWVDCTIPWLTTGDVHRLRGDEIEALDDTELRISELGLLNSAAVVHPAGTVALSRTASAGFSAVMTVPMATSQDFVVWRPSRHLDPYYLLWCLRVMRCDLLGRLAMGSTHKTIYFPDLESIRVPLPSLPEQTDAVARIRARMRDIVDLRESLRMALALLQERKRALITAAVTGEFDVSSASTRAAGAVTG